MLCHGKPQTGRFLAPLRTTWSSPRKRSGRLMPPAAPCGPSGRAATRAFSSASACRTAVATARMTASRPMAASATAVTAGGMANSSRFGNVISVGKSTVNSLVRNG